jgi:hypothetical protein
MKIRKRKWEEISPLEFLILRDRLGFKRYKKKIKRNPDERKMLIDLGLKKIKEMEKNNFLSLGYRKRKLII